MYYVDKDKACRSFCKYEARIFITQTAGGLSLCTECATEFICAFCQKSLEICCKLATFLPGQFCRVRVEYHLLESGIDIRKLSVDERAYFVEHNYLDIQKRLLRNIIFNLTLNQFTINEKYF